MTPKLRGKLPNCQNCNIYRLTAYLVIELKFEGDIAMKTKENLNALKEEVVILNKKLAELTEDELK